jgi:hypothetical protein
VVLDTDRLAWSVDADDAGAYTAVVLAGGDVTLKACESDTCVTVKRTKVAADETIDLTVK